jgi:hypothetical protein
MTPSQQPAPHIPKCKEWHINRIVEEMDEVYYYISRNDDFFAKCPSKEIADTIIEACSRPLPAAPEPLERFVLHLCKINQELYSVNNKLSKYENRELSSEEWDDVAELRGWSNALNWALIPDSELTLKEHDAAVAAQARADEREDVLEKLEKRLTKTWEEGKEKADDDEWWEQTHSFSLPYLKKEIESLRQPQENTGSTGDEKR